MAIRIRRVGDKYVAEVTPPEGQWKTPRPMTVEELAAALRDIGCDRDTASEAFGEAALQIYESLAEEFLPLIRAALNGDRQVLPQEPFIEAWLAEALFDRDKMLPLSEVLESADAVNSEIPNSDRISWAFLCLRRRSWLIVDGGLFGLTPEGRLAIEAIISQARAARPVYALEKWISTHPSR